MKVSHAIFTLIAGALFGFGLAYATMIQPEVVLSFLQFQDWGLMLVMGGGMGVALITYVLLPKLLPRPLLAESYEVRPRPWTRQAFIGSALFGIGWGLTGVCPGPAIAGLGAGNLSLLWAVAGMALGALLQGLLAKK